MSNKWEGKNFYEILGISTNAGRDEIRAVYRRLAFELHPDRNPNSDASDRLTEVIEAYSVLSNPDTRAEYDAVLFDDRPVIRARPAADGFNIGQAYDDIAASQSTEDLITAREEYLKYLDRNRRRKTIAEIVIAIIVLALLFAYGFSPLKTSSGPIAPSSTSSGSSKSGNSSSTSGNLGKGAGLNGVLTIIQGGNGAVGVIGKDGARGLDGRPGVDGLPGVAGAPGKDGIAGSVGATGPAGAAGPAGPAGAPGAPGAAGTQGIQGIQGEKGDPGTGVNGVAVTPNFGLTGARVSACTGDTTTAGSLTVTMTPSFESGRYKLGKINIGAFPASCSAPSTTLYVDLELDTGTYPSMTVECVDTLPTSAGLYPYTYHFTSSSTGCTWKTTGASMHINEIYVEDVARLNLALSG